jgi:hypothetical protein
MHSAECVRNRVLPAFLVLDDKVELEHQELQVVERFLVDG